MEKIMWGIFYVIVTTFLVYFFWKEKEIVSKIRKKEKNFIQKIEEKETNSEILNHLKIGNILTVLGLLLAIVFFYFVDKRPDYSVKIKLIGVYGVFLINVLIYIYRKEHEWILLSNLAMLFLSKLMFNILDVKFYIYLIINIILSAVLVFCFKNKIKDSVLKKKIKEIEKLNLSEEEKNKIIEEEKITKSSLGIALQRIDTTITAIILVWLLQAFYIGNYVIPTGSMEPTIKIGDRVFANMVKYKFIEPKVGDVIAFKEPITNKLMYTKRLVGLSGETLQIKDISLQKLVDPSSSENGIEEVNAGNIYLNDKQAEILKRPYTVEGIMKDNKIYIPKKGDKVKLDKIIMIEKLVGYTKKDNFRVSTADWGSFNRNEGYKEITTEEFLSRINTNKDFKKIIANSDEFDENDPKLDVYYTFTLKVEGRNELVLPIMDFKYNDDTFMKLLNGKAITLDKNYYVMMGDNTLNSLDSRYFGYVSEDRIKGNLLLRWFPLNRVGILNE